MEVSAMKIRIKFSKTGSMKFIGHLDIMRYFQKAIRRAEIDVTYTGGYSPHQVMSFAAPLGVGLESYGEYFDIEINSITDCEEIKKKLNHAMADGIEILSVRILPETAGNAMASVAAAEYEITFREGHFPDFEWQKAFQLFIEQDSIPVVKETKKSKKEFDLKPFIYSCKIREDKVTLIVDASSSDNVKPTLVFQAFMEHNGVQLSDFALLITRMETYTTKEGSDSKELISLEEIGYTA